MTEVNIEKIGKATGITSVVISGAMFVSKVEGMLAKKSLAINTITRPGEVSPEGIEPSTNGLKGRCSTS
jgi:hypothetical protein